MERTIVVFASKNKKKAEELQRMAPESIKIVPLSDIPEANGIKQAEENGKTFGENARIKAKYWTEKLNMTCLGEDSGIEIKALGGAPGVYTKRCIEQMCPGADIDVDDPAQVYPKFLEILEKSENPQYDAKWVSAMCIAMPSGRTICVEYSLEGQLCEAAGERVFGFDQYFRPNDSKLTLSEMEPHEKDKIGPRKRAFTSIIEVI